MLVTYCMLVDYYPLFIQLLRTCDDIHADGATMSVSHYHVDRLLCTFLFPPLLRFTITLHAAGSTMSVTYYPANRFLLTFLFRCTVLVILFLPLAPPCQ